MNKINFVDEKAFAKAIENNEPYNLGWFERNRNTLHTFISYYESCKESNWQPIETAPKDERILVYSPSYKECFVVFFAWSIDDMKDTQWVIAKGEDVTFVVRDPSHWMPLPTPPKEKL
jgi:hypothetical protein